MYYSEPEFGILSQQERQRRQQMTPEARRALRQGEAGQRKADRSTAQAARRQTDLNLAAIRAEKDPARKQALIEALSPEDTVVRNNRQAAGSFLRQTASTASQEGGTQSLLEQAQAGTTERGTSFIEQKTGIRLQLPGIRTTPGGGQWVAPESWASSRLKRIWVRAKKRAPEMVFFPKTRGLDRPINVALDDLNVIKADLDKMHTMLPQQPGSTRAVTTLTRTYLHAASGLLRNAVYASGSKQGQPVDEFGVVVIYAFTTRNIKIPANGASFIHRGGGAYIKDLKARVRRYRTRMEAQRVAPPQQQQQMVSRGLSSMVAPGERPQVAKAGGGGLLIGAVLVLGLGGLALKKLKGV